MQGHEWYEELCALAAIGQLWEEEAEELHGHLRTCERCKDVQGDYALILDQLPTVAMASFSSTGRVVREARCERFIRTAQATGIALTPEAMSRIRLMSWRNRERSWSWPRASFALAASVLVVLALLYVRNEKSQKITSQAAKVIPSENAAKDASVHAQFTGLPVREGVASSDGSIRDASQLQLKRLQEEVRQMRSEREQASAELGLWRKRFLELSSRSDADSRALEEAKGEVAKLQASQGEMIAALVEKGQRIRDLSAEISGQASVAERERELNAAARDVRELMAARSLHIIDVADVDGRGKARKSFGRVFYVEGQTLLFYAFDLGETAAPSKVLFQAWGQQEGTTGKPRNLGVFRVDDQAQKRWVLRVDDPKLLVSIDSLFVTVEPSPGTNEPTGRRLIYAFLGTPANHP